MSEEVKDYGDHYKEEDYTVEIKFRFRNEEAMKNFTSQLCDGWGEGLVDMHWPWRKGISFYETDTYCIDVPDEDGHYIGVEEDDA